MTVEHLPLSSLQCRHLLRQSRTAEMLAAALVLDACLLLPMMRIQTQLEVEHPDPGVDRTVDSKFDLAVSETKVDCNLIETAAEMSKGLKEQNLPADMRDHDFVNVYCQKGTFEEFDKSVAVVHCYSLSSVSEV